MLSAINLWPNKAVSTHTPVAASAVAAPRQPVQHPNFLPQTLDGSQIHSLLPSWEVSSASSNPYIAPGTNLQASNTQPQPSCLSTSSTSVTTQDSHKNLARGAHPPQLAPQEEAYEQPKDTSSPEFHKDVCSPAGTGSASTLPDSSIQKALGQKQKTWFSSELWGEQAHTPVSSSPPPSPPPLPKATVMVGPARIELPSPAAQLPPVLQTGVSGLKQQQQETPPQPAQQQPPHLLRQQLHIHPQQLKANETMNTLTAQHPVLPPASPGSRVSTPQQPLDQLPKHHTPALAHPKQPSRKPHASAKSSFASKHSLNEGSTATPQARRPGANQLSEPRALLPSKPRAVLFPDTQQTPPLLESNTLQTKSVQPASTGRTSAAPSSQTAARALSTHPQPAEQIVRKLPPALSAAHTPQQPATALPAANSSASVAHSSHNGLHTASNSTGDPSPAVNTPHLSRLQQLLNTQAPNQSTTPAPQPISHQSNSNIAVLPKPPLASRKTGPIHVQPSANALLPDTITQGVSYATVPASSRPSTLHSKDHANHPDSSRQRGDRLQLPQQPRTAPAVTSASRLQETKADLLDLADDDNPQWQEMLQSYDTVNNETVMLLQEDDLEHWYHPQQEGHVQAGSNTHVAGVSTPTDASKLASQRTEPEWKSTKLSGPELTLAIKSVTRLQDLENLFKKQHAQFNPIHTSSCLHKLATLYDSYKSSSQRMGRRPAKWELMKKKVDQIRRKLSRLLQRDLLELSPQAVATSLTALARLYCREAVVYDLIYCARQQMGLQGVGPQWFSNMIWSMARLRARPDEREWCEAFCRHSQSKLKQFSPQALATVIWGLGELRMRPTQPWVKAYVASLRPALPSLTVQGLCMVMQSCAALELALPAPLQDKCLRLCQKHIPSAEPQSLVIMLWSAAKWSGDKPVFTQRWLDKLMAALAQRLDDLSPLQLSTVLYAFAVMQRPPPADFLPAFEAAVISRLHGMNPQSLSNLMWSYGKLRLQPGPALLPLLLQQCKGGFAAFMPQALSNTIWALAKLDLQPDPRWLGAFLEQSYNKLPLTKPQELANIGWALAKLDCRPDALWLGRFTEEAHDRLDTNNIQNLSQIIWTLAKFQHTPGPDWVDAYFRQLQGRFSLISTIQISDIMWAVAELKVRPSVPVLTRFVAQITRDIQAMRGSQLAHVVYSLARLGIKPKAEWLDLLLREMLYDLSSFDTESLTNVVWSLGRIQHAPADEWMQQIGQAALQQLPDMQGAALTKLIVGFADMGYRPGQDWLQAFAARMKTLGVGELGAADVLNCMGALSKLGYAGTGELMTYMSQQAFRSRLL